MRAVPRSAIVARNLFPGGVEIPYEGLSHQEQLDMTAAEIRKGTKTLYEATFSYNNVFMKADILHKGAARMGAL